MPAARPAVAPGSPAWRLRRLIDAMPPESRPTPRELAKRTGLSRETIRVVLNGGTPNPGVETVGRILGAVGLTLSDYDGIARGNVAPAAERS